jgi:hypothetical protein
MRFLQPHFLEGFAKNPVCYVLKFLAISQFSGILTYDRNMVINACLYSFLIE